jgi:hypothetical protein
MTNQNKLPYKVSDHRKRLPSLEMPCGDSPQVSSYITSLLIIYIIIHVLMWSALYEAHESVLVDHLIRSRFTNDPGPVTFYL